ncbi:MAG: hypothetical protein H7249_04820 [Chitinophagaceae bacterium]|nr:hypothetical protein [Oligoflexus sp.]
MYIKPAKTVRFSSWRKELILGILLGCSLPLPGSDLAFAEEQRPQDGQAATPASPAALFRNIFYSYAGADYSKEEIDKLIFQAPPAFSEQTLVIGNPIEALNRRTKDWSHFKPIDLYKAGVDLPVDQTPPVEEGRSAQPVTIVIIPGVFGEFINDLPFNEVLSNKTSAFAEKWAQAIADHPATDPVYDFETMAETDHSLSEIIEAASLDDAQGRSLVRVLYMKPLYFSLESLGTLEDARTRYLRRLGKVWDVLGPQPNVYLLGYSRGVNVALAMLNTAEKTPSAYPWYKNVKGVVSLGGTLYGSRLAEVATTPGQAFYAEFQRIRDLADELTPISSQLSLPGRITAIAKNTLAWARAERDLLVVATTIGIPKGLILEHIESDLPNKYALTTMIKKFAFEKFKIGQSAEYSNNIKRFKVLVEKAAEGIQSLTPKNCLGWLKTHTIPAQLKYYVIQGTMADPSTMLGGVSPLIKNSPSFNTRALDYKLIRWSYYQTYAYSGMAINDSQVSPDRSVFWPSLHTALNPAQAPFRSALLAVVGTDHWGMSFPVAFESKNNEVSLFPRTILLKTLGAFLIQDPAI